MKNVERTRYFKQLVSIDGVELVDTIGVYYDNGEELLYQKSYLIDKNEYVELNKADMSIDKDDEELSEEEAEYLLLSEYIE